jgi:hypothetical protein
MDFARREIALMTMAVGVIMVCLAAWMQHRRQYRVMPPLISPLPLMIFGVAIALLSLIVAILPNRL